MATSTNPAMITDAAVETSISGVAWAAILGGAFAAIGVSLILTPLGSALGFAAFSPWHQDMGSGKALSVATAIWLIVAQWISSALGGYLTGRLRTKWAGAHTHEVFFRDTAHGFLSWVLATVFGFWVLMSAASHFANGLGHMAEKGMSPESYYTDSLFRSAQGSTDVPESDRRQAAHILAEGVVMKGGIQANDRNYLAQIISAHTGISPVDADARVDDTINRQKAAMDTSRKRAAEFSFILSIAMLVGAFIASAAAALGGRDRDNHYATGRLTPL